CRDPSGSFRRWRDRILREQRQRGRVRPGEIARHWRGGRCRQVEWSRDCGPTSSGPCRDIARKNCACVGWRRGRGHATRASKEGDESQEIYEGGKREVQELRAEEKTSCVSCEAARRRDVSRP